MAEEPNVSRVAERENIAHFFRCATCRPPVPVPCETAGQRRGSSPAREHPGVLSRCSVGA